MQDVETPRLNLSDRENMRVGPWTKGMPGGAPMRLGDIGRQGWNVLREDLPLPLAILKRSAIEHNISWMRRFLALSGAALCPHGKTTMSPQLFDLQLRAGAWGLTAATPSQVQVYRGLGAPRILLANQLVGRSALRFVFDELRRDPGFDFYCLADSLDGVAILAAAAAEAKAGRPLQVLIELGRAGARAGVRSVADGLAVAEAVRAAEPLLSLRGVEAFEGAVEVDALPETLARIDALMADMGALAEACGARDLFGEGPVILTAGGSQFFDIPARTLASIRLPQPTLVVLRSGCYLTHDSALYGRYAQAVLDRMPQARALGDGLKPALEVWAYVLSRPEPGLVIASLGKRDCSYDFEPPTPTVWLRPGEPGPPRPLDGAHRVVRLDDQHACLAAPTDSPLKVGDLVGFGVSHPCTTFDKWRVLPVVDDAYDVTGAVETFF